MTNSTFTAPFHANVSEQHLHAATPKKTIALVGKYSAEGISSDLWALAQFLIDAGHSVVFEQETANNLSFSDCKVMPPSEIGQHADVAIVLGGDGTMLGIARQLAPYKVPLIGINQGRLGFMTDIPIEQTYVALSEILAGNYQFDERTLLEGMVIRMVELKVTVDDHFMYNQRSDGFIVSTPTGSTAYALSAGGPLLHPSLRGIVFVPIAPHDLSNRPIVVADSSKIIIEVSNTRAASVNFDMQSFAELLVGDQIHIQRSEHVICFLHPKDWNYYHTLREKMHWHEYPSVAGHLK